MGTVPDPLRLTKSSLIGNPEKQEDFEDQQPSIPQQTSIIAYSNANSLPCFPSESVRIGLLDLSCPRPVESIMKDSEHDLTQTVMSSGISSEDEKLPPTYNSPSDSSQHQGSSEHVAQISSALVDLTHTVARVPTKEETSRPTPCDEPKILTDVVSLTSFEQSSKTSQQSSLTSKQLVCFTEQGKTLQAEHLSSRFKETGTMTSLDESGFVAEERANRTWQDAEVQTVTSVESRSVSTSPSILATLLNKIPPPETLEEQEHLYVIYQSNSNMNNPSGLFDKLVGPNFDNKREVHIQGATGDSSNIPTFQVDNKVTDSAATVFKVASNNGMSNLCFLHASSENKTICKEKQQAVEMVSEGETQVLTQAVPPTPIPSNAKPVDKISTHACNQADVSHGLEKAEIKSSELSTKTVNACQAESTPSDPHHKPLSPDNELNKSDNLNVTDKSSATEKTLPTQIVKGDHTDPKADIKPKMETKAELLCPNAEGLSVLTPNTGRKNQDKASDESKQTKSVTSLGLPGELMGESSPNSGKRTPSRSIKASPRRASRVSEFLKEQKLNVTAAAAQVGFTPGEKKKQLASDAKLQFKQSKQVRDVIWDEQGMTWEVYGASLDPESLGLAIQNHLQKQIKEHEKLINVQSNQSRKSISSDTSSNKKLKGRQHNMFQAMMQNFRRPNCCVHPAPSSVLD
ncbi:G protein-regulated inducer of neurite outgrowth 3 [Antechinus flavipes]|uniref:G protein-regulated inducer of neurite outgrowth 3 n=1 Tax=Antechinus flavipes TaxID=38775 RepID=UPI0022363D8A|nr:G protein-regulated inducer of neurite outgrowth 3 [Antechinus flavipes]